MLMGVDLLTAIQLIGWVLLMAFSWIGENLYVTSTSNPEVTMNTAIQAWYDEISNYNYDSNTCEPGKACGHYTQV